MAFQKVRRKSAKMRVALAGPSGAGKTLSALYLAYGVTQDWGKIALIDTEHGRGQFYGSRTLMVASSAIAKVRTGFRRSYRKKRRLSDLSTAVLWRD